MLRGARLWDWLVSIFGVMGLAKRSVHHSYSDRSSRMRLADLLQTQICVAVSVGVGESHVPACSVRDDDDAECTPRVR